MNAFSANQQVQKVQQQLAQVDPKNQLSQFCQKFCQRPVTKTDIVYTTSKFGYQYQSIVKLNCLGGAEYAGNLSANPKDAEKLAAQQAMLANANTPIPDKPSAEKRKLQQKSS